MNVQHARQGLIVKDDRGNTFEVVGFDGPAESLELESVVTKERFTRVPASEVEPLEGLRARR